MIHRRIQMFTLAALLSAGSAYGIDVPLSAFGNSLAEGTYSPDVEHCSGVNLLPSDMGRLTITFDTRDHIDPAQRVILRLLIDQNGSWVQKIAIGRDGGPNLNKLGEPISATGFFCSDCQGAIMKTCITITQNPKFAGLSAVGPLRTSTAIIAEGRPR